MKEWDYTRLKISPCRFTGSYYSDDLVICAHNFDRHLGRLLHIELGVDVYFTNVEGLMIHYIVTNRETVQPTDVELMIENTGNSETSLLDWDMTLFTCTLGGQSRVTVRGVEIKE
jgi:sortase A